MTWLKNLRIDYYQYSNLFFFAVLFIAVVATLYHELAHINFKQTLEAFSKINRWYLVGLFICGGSAMILLSLYDLILVKG